MNRILTILLVILTIALVAAGTVHPSSLAPAKTPDGAVRALYEHAKGRDFKGSYLYVSPTSNTDEQSFIRDLGGRDGSLRTYSNLENVDTRILHEDDSVAMVRATTEWSTAIGAFYDTRDLKVVNDNGTWKVEWPVAKVEKVPPQVIPVNYLRWDIITRGGDDDWGAQNVEAPRVRIVSMNAIERDGATIVLGEIENEDTVPAFVSVNATLVDKNAAVIGEESSFDKISHTLLPKEISPFRIDFPRVKLANVKSVRMQPNSMLVAASADPVIGVLHERVDKDLRGRPVLKGELLNESGLTVNLPHVLATYYDGSGKVVWVSDGYVDQALQPQTPIPFSVGLQQDIAQNVHNYRVTVNQYSLDRAQ
jgi:hypothetical protein